MAFFTGPDVEEIPTAAVSFRAMSKTSAALRNSAISAGRIAVVMSTWMGERFALPTPELPTLSGYDPETAARVVREKWGLGTAPIPNLLDVLEAHGVRVFSLAMDVVEIDAFSFFRHKTPFILMNTSKSGERQRFDAAHELGHLVLHAEENPPSGREAEAQAHRFAAAFLMPREDVMSLPLWNVGAQTVITAKKRWRVAAMALAHRLRELEMVTEWGYRDLCIQLSRSGYRRGEPQNATVPETSQVLRKILSALRADGISPADVANEVHLEVKELNAHMFGLVPLVVEGEGGGQKSRATLRLVN
ncbi:ImmA/IrrE family metallo-endopeptidase [Arthrobacter globiformis]|uniref:ImmA/IrrE family metallo-endopeptidase n=1 Tax=Arthrobacter globiformis TaxID=1665 RepID=UPI0021D52802|nr:ImmA/IrrE family metallo-endopeptidase [Arthrobacter globiformis]